MKTTYINYPAEGSFLLAELVLVGQVAEQKQLFFDALVLRRRYLGRPALIRPNLRLGHF